MNAVTPIPQPHSGSRIALLSSKTLGWQGFGAELVNVSAGLHRIPALKHHRVGVHVGAPVKARCVCNERRYSRIQAHGDADVIPAGVDGQWMLTTSACARSGASSSFRPAKIAVAPKASARRAVSRPIRPAPTTSTSVPFASRLLMSLTSVLTTPLVCGFQASVTSAKRLG